MQYHHYQQFILKLDSTAWTKEVTDRAIRIEMILKIHGIMAGLHRGNLPARTNM